MWWQVNKLILCEVKTHQTLNLGIYSRPEICFDFGNWKVVFCILSAVSKKGIELIDLERDEDFGLHYTRSGYDLQN